MSSVAVIGAGLGGLATAVRLARRGYRVTVLEKTDRTGGKLNIMRSAGYLFDTGPTLLTMPFVLHELFHAVGRRVEDYIQLVPLEPVCRYTWSDGSKLDAFSDIRRTAEEIRALSASDADQVQRFFRHAETIFRHAARPFLVTPFGSLGVAGLLANRRHLPSLLQIDAFRTLDRAVSTCFQDPRIRQLFNRFATYNGSSPYRAPATLAIIPYVEFAMGGWYIRGGMYRLAEVLSAIARKEGAVIATGCTVRRILHRNGTATGVETEDGRVMQSDAVVCNADALYAHRSLIDRKALKKPDRYTAVETSLSGFVMLLGVRKTFPGLAHHNVFFSADYQEEFRSLLDRGRPSDDPTVYVSLSCASDSDHAPPGGSNLFILVNAPPLGPSFDWQLETTGYRRTVLATLARHGVSGIEESIDTEILMTPQDFAAQFNAFRGSIYGTSSNGRMAAFLRPPNRSRDLRNLYFVGGSSHPGGGIPLVLLSGQTVAGLISADIRP